ncbi:hypothetical protein [Moorena sp. SIO3I6]|uniref:hypothetical protein n=1 Tax=Moorena sp. SIO3I6 TaxID=2607831 RepID=UPI0013FA2207|nr:hypothetical protein [Moorena sp. SIO3I6]NEP23075.1 hypothetical protein [Moorena sp. SIO3I6]
MGKNSSQCQKKLVEGMAQQIDNLEKQLRDISAVQQQLLEKKPTHIKELIIASFL